MVDALRTYFLLSTDLTSLIGARFYQITAQAGLPDGTSYVVARITGRHTNRDVRGARPTDSTTVQISSFARTVAEAKTIRDAVYAVISRDGFSGSWGSVAVQFANWTDEVEIYHDHILMVEIQLILSVTYTV
jgi:hypothetical protein